MTKAQMWASINSKTGLFGDDKPEGRPLTSDESHLLVSLLMLEREDANIPKKVYKSVDESIAVQMLKKRIEVLGLPIKFSDMAYASITVFCKIPGHVVLLLIDCLEEFENETVTVDKLCMLYPTGFYTQEAFEKIISNSEEFNKRKWAYIY